LLLPAHIWLVIICTDTSNQSPIKKHGNKGQGTISATHAAAVVFGVHRSAQAVSRLEPPLAAR